MLNVINIGTKLRPVPDEKITPEELLLIEYGFDHPSGEPIMEELPEAALAIAEDVLKFSNAIDEQINIKVIDGDHPIATRDVLAVYKMLVYRTATQALAANAEARTYKHVAIIAVVGCIAIAGLQLF